MRRCRDTTSSAEAVDVGTLWNPGVTRFWAAMAAALLRWDRDEFAGDAGDGAVEGSVVPVGRPEDTPLADGDEPAVLTVSDKVGGGGGGGGSRRGRRGTPGPCDAADSEGADGGSRGGKTSYTQAGFCRERRQLLQGCSWLQRILRRRHSVQDLDSQQRSHETTSSESSSDSRRQTDDDKDAANRCYSSDQCSCRRRCSHHSSPKYWGHAMRITYTAGRRRRRTSGSAKGKAP